MFSLFNLVVGAVVVVAVIALINPLTGKAILATVSGSTGALGRWLRSQFPVWIMQYELDKASRDINYYWGVIEENKAHYNGLNRKANDKRREVTRLGKLAEQAASQNTLEGDTDAKSFLKDQKRVQSELDSIETMLVTKQEEVDSALANISQYEQFVQDTKAEAEAKSVSLKTKKADAALSRKLQGLNDLNNSGLALAKESLNQAMDAANAATDINNVRNRKVTAERKYTQATIETEVDEDLKALKARLAANKSQTSS